MRWTFCSLVWLAACGGVTTTAYTTASGDDEDTIGFIMPTASETGPSGSGPSGTSGEDSGGTSSGGVDSIGNECPPGQANCGSGCVDLQNEEEHCGACNNACDFNEVCQGGQCGCAPVTGAEFFVRQVDVWTGPVPRNGPLLLHAACRFDPETIEESIVVRGDLAGPVAGTITLQDPETLAFVPSSPFEAGDRIVALSKPTLTVGGQSVPTARIAVHVEAEGMNTPSLVDTMQDIGTFDGRDVELADIDCDQDLDVIVATLSGLRVWSNDGNANLTEQLPLDDAGTRLVATGDFDGNGTMDFVAAPNAAGPMSRWRNNPCGTLTLDTTLGNADAVALAPAWVDANASLDLVIGTAGAADEVWNNDGTFSLSGAALLPASGGTTAAVVVQSSGRRLPDLRFGGTAKSDGGRWLNDGSGNFTQNQSGWLANVRSIATGHFNTDGGEDLVVGTGAGELNGASTNAELGTSEVNDIAVGDFDGNGRPDVLFATGSGVGSELWVQAGNGYFVLTWTGPTDDARGVAVGDLDGDLDLDAVIVQDAGPIRVFLNQ